MSTKWRRIPAAVDRALSENAVCEGPLVRITTELDSALFTEVRFVLETLGAVFVRGTTVFEFAAGQDADAIVHETLLAGIVKRPAKLPDFLDTPDPLAEDIVSLYANVFPPQQRVRVLEPSASTGSIVRAVLRCMDWLDLQITAVEPDARRARQIVVDDRVRTEVQTFETFAGRARAADERFDLVVMSPPFVDAARNTLWIDHLLRAWELLAPGGRLVAILPHSVVDETRRGKRRPAYHLVRLHGQTRDLGVDAFLEAGARCQTVVAWLDRPVAGAPLPTPAPVHHPALFRRYTGDEVPVPVARPYLTRAAARSMPVQVWHDPHHDAERVLRFWADCVVCTRALWSFDDVDEFPFSVLGDASATFAAYPEVDSVDLVPVGVCPMCANHHDKAQRAHEVARKLWEEQTPAPVPLPSGTGASY